MGGTGSERSAERGTVGGAFRLKLGDLLAALPPGRPSAGDVQFTATIACPGGRLCRATEEIRAEVSLGASGGTLRLRYDARPYSPIGAVIPTVPVDQRIPIVRQAQHFGGA